MPKVRPERRGGKGGLGYGDPKTAKRPLPSSNQLRQAKEHITLLSKIDDVSVDDRAWAINSIARLIAVDSDVFQLVVSHENSLLSILKRMFDSELSVQVAAVGVLLNVMVHGVDGSQMVEKLLRFDILSAIVPVLTTNRVKLLQLAVSGQDSDMRSQAELFLSHTLSLLSHLWYPFVRFCLSCRNCIPLSLHA